MVYCQWSISYMYKYMYFGNKCIIVYVIVWIHSDVLSKLFVEKLVSIRMNKFRAHNFVT